MGLATTLYRFRIDLSDIDRGLYETLDFRLALHPSETLASLLTKVIAFALNTNSTEPRALELSPLGLGDPDAPAMSRPGQHGGLQLWIEVGNPSPKKLHKASKASDVVKVYTYKNAHLILAEMAQTPVYRASAIEIFSIPTVFLESLAESLQRDNEWSLIHHDGSLTVHAGSKSETADLTRHPVPI